MAIMLSNSRVHWFVVAGACVIAGLSTQAPAQCTCDADLIPDGVIDAMDVTACLSCLSGTFPQGGPTACDVECDGDIDACDCRSVVNAVAGLAGSCPPCDGDLTDDGFIDIDDVVACLSCQTGVFPAPYGACACDVDHNGIIDPCDCMAPVYGGDDTACDLARGDIYPPATGGNGLVDVDDVLCVLAAFSGGLALCPTADVAPCPIATNGVVDVDDILAVLAAFSGAGCCP